MIETKVRKTAVNYVWYVLGENNNDEDTLLYDVKFVYYIYTESFVWEKQQQNKLTRSRYNHME